MSITLGSGITIASGVGLGAGSPAPSGPLQFNPAYNYNNPGFGGGPALAYSNSDLTVLDNYPGEYSTLTTVQFVPGNKYMASFTLDFYSDPVSWIGIGTPSIDTSQGLGADSNSIGFNSVGDYRFGGTVYGTGYCNFTNVGDIIDIAVDTSVNLMWIRVNGGNWNNYPSGNPATQSNGLAIGGLSNGYFALAVGGYSFYSQFSINNTSTYSVPAGFTFLGAGTSGFTISSSDFTNYGNGYNVTPNGTTGFYNANGQGPGTNLYNVFLGALNGAPNPAKFNQIAAYWAANGLTPNTASYIFDVTWGAGSSPTSNKVVLTFNNDPNYGSLLIGTVYTGDNVWQTGGQDIYNSFLKSAAGTYNFPATFTLYSPLITDSSNWC